ncbi:uncharacterized protein LOC129975018 [Argiope bruennichi]|uniref:uncharacterized protein LOC129975018 n=1 Tax=Argiope bruennichi TaxID=94029 RepID=UPI002494E614|nr:uncharacterized protein LOC129975018 [Argiope bruennichi]
MGSSKKSPFSGHRKVPNLFTNLPQFDRFFILKRISDKNETFNSVSPFLVQKAISATIGDVISTRKMRSGDLLIEVSNKKQAQQVMKMKAIAHIPVTAASHTSLNFSKGVITCGELFNVPLEEITAELKSQGVTHVRQITIRRDEQLLPTKHYILTFHRPTIPEFIYAGYIKLLVRQYIPNPLRCFKCQRFGHSKISCRGTLTCARCAGKDHDSEQCNAPEKCVNCGGCHASFSRACERWKIEKQITSIKFKESISYSEARQKVLAQTPKPGVSYASVVKTPFCANCQCTNCVKYNSQTTTVKNSSDSEIENSPSSAPETSKPVRSKSKSNSNSQRALKLKLSKRGLSPKELRTKLKKSATQSSVALGLATKGNVHKDLTSIFGSPKSPDSISLHPSDEEDELQMSCDVSPTLHNTCHYKLDTSVT